MGASGSVSDVLRAEKVKPLDGHDVATPRGVTALAEVKRLRALLAHHTHANITLLAQAKFEELDVNNNGFLNNSELEKVTDWVLSVYRPVDNVISEQEKKRIRATVINRLDNNHDGRLDLYEFSELFAEVTSTAELMARAKFKFEELDKDKSGYLELLELDQLAEWVLDIYNPLGFNEDDRAELKKKLMKRIDSNKDGKLDLYEFSTIFQEVTAKAEVMLKAKAKFHELDDNKNGFIEADELNAVANWVLTTYNPMGITISEDDRSDAKAKLMRRIDLNNDGKLDIKEFGKLFEEIMERIDINRRAKEKFEELDSNGNGTLETAELVIVADWVLKTYGTVDDLEKTKQMIMDRVDANKDGKLDLHEFTILMEEVNARIVAMKNAMDKFHELDENGNGVLDKQELLEVADYVLKTFYPDGAPLSPEEKEKFKDDMMTKVDINHDGQLTLNEFSILFDQHYTSTTNPFSKSEKKD